MFDHVKFGVSNFSTGKAFYVQALAPLGVTAVRDWPPDGVEMYHPQGTVSLCLYQAAETPAHLHLAFQAATRTQVNGVILQQPPTGH